MPSPKNPWIPPLLEMDPGTWELARQIAPESAWHAAFNLEGSSPGNPSPSEPVFRLVAPEPEKPRSNWKLEAIHEPKWKALEVNFHLGPLAFRWARSKVSHEPLRRLIRLEDVERPVIWDGTLGLGEDGFMMAFWGARVVSYERNPLLLFLVSQAFESFRRAHPEISEHLDWRLCYGDAREAFRAAAQAEASERPDIVYLDPLYPDRRKPALGSKELRLIRELVGDPPVEENEELLRSACACAKRKTLLKRPLHAQTLALAGRKPQSARGRSTRWDIYPGLVSAGVSGHD